MEYNKKQYIDNLDAFVKENLRKEAICAPTGWISPNDKSWMMFVMNQSELGGVLTFSNKTLGRREVDKICTKYNIENKY